MNSISAVGAAQPPCGLGGGLPLDMARAQVLALCRSPMPVASVPVGDSAGRVLAAPFHAVLDLPPFAQAAMDGYAVASTALSERACLPVVGATAAGSPPGVLLAGTTHRILTGAPMPAGADAVIAQEQVVRHGGAIGIGAIPTCGENVRRRGEDVASATPLIADGTVIDWRHIAILAAQGVHHVRVRRRPVVAILSIGHELRAAGAALRPGEIHDSNLPMLSGLLEAAGAAVRPLPIAADDVVAIRAALREAADGADIVLTSAGMSVGDEDHVQAALATVARECFVLDVAMKPGKTLSAGLLEHAVFVALPGNPLAALAGAMAFVLPLLDALLRRTGMAPAQARASFAAQYRLGRTEFVPVRVQRQPDGCWAERAGPNGSGRLAPLLHATGLALLPPDRSILRMGDVVDVLDFGLCGTRLSQQIPSG